MKRMTVWAAGLLSVMITTACGRAELDTSGMDDPIAAQEETEITLWTFPVGNWGNPTAASALISDFRQQHPDIHVSVEYLTYDNGDERIERAVAEGNAPDLVLEGPERLVANWGDKGLMVDLTDLWGSDTADMIYDNIREACQRDGVFYEYPLCMTTHCMAINHDMFREAGALRYIDEETHTWTTEDFVSAVGALRAHGQERVGALYCKNQSGDQGTRALVNNLYGGTFTDEGHTRYTVDSEENIRALQLLYDLEGIVFDPSIGAADEIAQFCRGELAMAFCWNVSQEIKQTINDPALDFEIFPMAFPTSTGVPMLQGGIWGFGIFDNGDAQKIEAAKTFIRYVAQEDGPYMRAVQISTYWPVRDIGDIYVNDMLMEEYSVFMQYMGDHYQITPGWTDARAKWWQMLQEIGAGADIRTAAQDFTSSVNVLEK